MQAPQWTDFLSCPICTQTFDETIRKPISLGCGHTVCKMCLNKLHRKACPFDQTTINTDIEFLPVNSALLQLVGAQVCWVTSSRPFYFSLFYSFWLLLFWDHTHCCSRLTPDSPLRDHFSQSSWDHMQFHEWNLGWLHGRQTPAVLYCPFGSMCVLLLLEPIALIIE